MNTPVTTPAPPPGGTAVRLGLQENLGQFALLVVVNAFVGAMVGLERSILPAMAEQGFGLEARTAILSFIVVFGVAKALTNYGAGRLSDRLGRKHVLVAGWVVAVPVRAVNYSCRRAGLLIALGREARGHGVHVPAAGARDGQALGRDSTHTDGQAGQHQRHVRLHVTRSSRSQR